MSFYFFGLGTQNVLFLAILKYFFWGIYLRNVNMTDSRWPNEYDQKFWTWPKNSLQRTLALEHDDLNIVEIFNNCPHICMLIAKSSFSYRKKYETLSMYIPSHKQDHDQRLKLEQLKREIINSFSPSCIPQIWRRLTYQWAK